MINVQTGQSTDTDLNKLVCNSNDPYRAKRMRGILKALSSREGLTAPSQPGRHGQLKWLRCTMFNPRVVDKVEEVTAVMQRQVRNSQTIQRIVRIPRFSTSRSRRFPDRVR